MAQMQGSSGSTAGAGKCAHSACRCSVPAGKRYCSEYCEKTRDSAPMSKAGCGCNHPSCKSS